MMVVTKLKDVALIQPRHLLQCAQVTRAWCGPELEPMTALASPHKQVPGSVTSKPRTLVEGAVASKRFNCPGNIL
jgi:hypothetical protein